MFSRNTGLLAVMTVAMLLLGGCGTDSAANGKASDQAQARHWYDEMQGKGSITNDVTPDGYGIYSGGPITGSNTGSGMLNTDINPNGERNTYGMRENGTDSGTTLGDDMRNAWDDLKDDLKNMGKDDNGSK